MCLLRGRKSISYCDRIRGEPEATKANSQSLGDAIIFFRMMQNRNTSAEVFPALAPASHYQASQRGVQKDKVSKKMGKLWCKPMILETWTANTEVVHLWGLRWFNVELRLVTAVAETTSEANEIERKQRSSLVCLQETLTLSVWVMAPKMIGLSLVQ